MERLLCVRPRAWLDASSVARVRGRKKPPPRTLARFREVSGEMEAVGCRGEVLRDPPEELAGLRGYS
jgi:hypothetical protein